MVTVCESVFQSLRCEVKQQGHQTLNSGWDSKVTMRGVMESFRLSPFRLLECTFHDDR